MHAVLNNCLFDPENPSINLDILISKCILNQFRQPKLEKATYLSHQKHFCSAMSQIFFPDA